MIASLEQLHLFEQIQAAKLLQENRIGFGFGTFHILNDELDNAEYGIRNSTDIKGSRARIETTKALLRKNQQLTITLDVHCGIAAPNHFVANQFSQTRGQAALEAFADVLHAATAQQQQQNEETSGDTTSTTSTTRVFMKAWGKRAAQAAANSNHPVFGALAKQGKGWAEIRFGMLQGHNNNNNGVTNDDEEELLFQIPPRPAFYEGLTPEDDIVAAEEEEEDIAGVWWVLEEQDVE